MRTTPRVCVVASVVIAVAVSPALAEEPFDYFRNNWNVIGLKDYRRGG